MASRREDVLDAVKAMITAALPGADVTRNRAKSTKLTVGGMVVVRDGDPGEPEVILSPLLYTYSHQVVLEFAAYESQSQTREQVLDGMMADVGRACELDRTLGGLCEWIEPGAPEPDDAETLGAEPIRWASIPLMAVYTTSNPLT